MVVLESISGKKCKNIIYAARRIWQDPEVMQASDLNGKYVSVHWITALESQNSQTLQREKCMKTWIDCFSVWDSV